MPPKTNEEIVEKIKNYDENVGYVCYPDSVLKALTEKDKEKEEAVADIISVVLDAEIKTGDKDEILMMLQALTPHTN